MVHVELKRKVQDKQAIIERHLNEYKELDESIKEAKMDYDMEKMTIN
jgi:hypothetical protein